MRTNFDEVIETLRSRHAYAEAPSADFVERTMAKLARAGAFAPPERGPVHPTPALWRVAAPALAACLMLILGIAVLRSKGTDRHSPQPLGAPAGTGTRNGATLSDDIETEREPAGQNATLDAGGSSDIEGDGSNLNQIAPSNPKNHGDVNERATPSDPSDGLPMDPVGCYYAADPSFIQRDRRSQPNEEK